MSQNIQYMRYKVTNLYPSFVWKDRVAHMDDRQVTAIYHRVLETTPLLFKDSRRISDRFAYAKDPNAKPEEYHQITIFEYMTQKEAQNGKLEGFGQ